MQLHVADEQIRQIRPTSSWSNPGLMAQIVDESRNAVRDLREPTRT